MTPRAHRRKLAAAALAVACAVVYLWMLFAWETAWGIDLKHRASAAELVFATVGARPDLGDILRRANEELGADADVLIGGPQRLVDGLEDRLKDRVVERMTWAM